MGQAQSGSVPGPWHVPGVGAFARVKSDAVNYLQELRADYGDVVRFWLGPHHMWMISDPKEIHRITVVEGRKYLDKSRLYKSLCPVIGDGLITSGGEKWKKHRKLMQPAFKDEIIERSVGVFAKTAERNVGAWDGGPVLIGKSMREIAPLRVNKGETGRTH